MDLSVFSNTEHKLKSQSAINHKGSENVGGTGHDISHDIASPPLTDTSVIFSSQKINMDDLTSRGMETRTGVPKDNLAYFGTKELIDNCVDYHETHQRNLNDDKDTTPKIRIQILQESGIVRILVRNSNPYFNTQDIFTNERLGRIFDLGGFYSSKRYQFKITRGALGDAFKEVLRIPYILATEGQHQIAIDWKEPLLIRTSQKRFRIFLHVDRVKQSRESEVEEFIHQNRCNDDENFTEVELRIPTNSLNLTELNRFLRDYVIAVPHIDITIVNENGGVSRFQQVQPIERYWTNTCSIYYYTIHEFREFILGLEDGSMTVHHVLRSIFREGSNMRKTELTSKSIDQLKHNPELILQIFEQLRDPNLNHLGPISDPSDLSLPFNSNKKLRAVALKKRFEQSGFEIVDLKYKSKFGYYKDEETGVEFPFFFEIAVVSTTDLANNLYYVESINSSVMPGCYSFMRGPEGTFRWETRSEKYRYSSGSIFQIFEHFGYSSDRRKCKKPHTLIFVNLISPKISYKSYGKSIINLRPFASVIAETVVKACSGGGGCHNSKYDDQGNRINATSIFTEYLIKRYKEVLLNPDLKKNDRWNTSTPVYRIRPTLQEHGIIRTRRYLQGLVKNICDKIPEFKPVNSQFIKTGKIGVEREALGIFEATRAHIYFRGKTYDVSFEALEYIKRVATFILIIEKAGIVELLAPYADKYGFALCDTGGFLTDNAKKFSRLANSEGARVAILTDGDMTGRAISGEVLGIPRIGISLETLQILDIPIKEVAEDLDKDSPHKKSAEKLYYQGLILEEDWEFLNSNEHGRRVEIDNVIGYAGTEKFWNEFILPSFAK